MSSAKVRLQCGRVWLEVDVSGVKDAMKALGEYQEVFLERKCGMCGKEDILYEHRQDNDSHDYYSLKCVDCGAQLDFGQHNAEQRAMRAELDRIKKCINQLAYDHPDTAVSWPHNGKTYYQEIRDWAAHVLRQPT